jgi:hypothetical protein
VPYQALVIRESAMLFPGFTPWGQKAFSAREPGAVEVYSPDSGDCTALESPSRPGKRARKSSALGRLAPILRHRIDWSLANGRKKGDRHVYWPVPFVQPNKRARPLCAPLRLFRGGWPGQRVAMPRSKLACACRFVPALRSSATPATHPIALPFSGRRPSFAGQQPSLYGLVLPSPMEDAYPEQIEAVSGHLSDVIHVAKLGARERTVPSSSVPTGFDQGLLKGHFQIPFRSYRDLRSGRAIYQ